MQLARSSEAHVGQRETKAADVLVAEGKLAATDIPDTDGYKTATTELIDGVEYDGRKPNA